MSRAMPHQVNGIRSGESIVRPRSVREKGGAGVTPSSMSSIITELQEKPAGPEFDHRDQYDAVVEEVVEQNRMQDEYQLSSRWREIAGESDWVGLLDPMDPLLRSELIRYGEMAQACYDAFDYDPFSKYCGSCKYTRRHLFESLGLASMGYEVTRYLYATSNIRLPNFLIRSRFPKVWSELANWIGYVAVSGDEATARLGRRDIAVAWRGTVTRLEWLADLTDFLRPVREDGFPTEDPDIKVECGFLDLYTDKKPHCRFCKFSAREQVLAEVRRLVHHYGVENGEDISISITGHSLGSALAMLSAYDMAEGGINKYQRDDATNTDPDEYTRSSTKTVPITVYSFSGPRVGNRNFKERFEGELGIKALRVVNVHDAVPKVPGMILNEHVRNNLIRGVVERLLPLWAYTHVGVELQLDHRRSPFLKETSDPSCFHNLEAHLHLLDGYHGKGKRFVLSSGRDPALVNKACDFLKDHHLVPPFWRQDQNKGMILSRDGRWVQPERAKIDEHPEDIQQHLSVIKHLLRRGGRDNESA